MPEVAVTHKPTSYCRKQIKKKNVIPYELLVFCLIMGQD